MHGLPDALAPPAPDSHLTGLIAAMAQQHIMQQQQQQYHQAAAVAAAAMHQQQQQLQRMQQQQQPPSQQPQHEQQQPPMQQHEQPPHMSAGPPYPPPAQQQPPLQAPAQQHRRERPSFSGSVGSLDAEPHHDGPAASGSGSLGSGDAFAGLPPRPPSVGHSGPLGGPGGYGAAFGPGGACQPGGSVIGGELRRMPDRWARLALCSGLPLRRLRTCRASAWELLANACHDCRAFPLPLHSPLRSSPFHSQTHCISPLPLRPAAGLTRGPSLPARTSWRWPAAPCARCSSSSSSPSGRRRRRGRRSRGARTGAASWPPRLAAAAPRPSTACIRQTPTQRTWRAPIQRLRSPARSRTRFRRC